MRDLIEADYPGLADEKLLAGLKKYRGKIIFEEILSILKIADTSQRREECKAALGRRGMDLAID